MADNTGPQARQQQAALKRLDALAGEWSVQIAHPLIPDTIIRGRAAFEWFEGGYFLIERASVQHPGFPKGLIIIGYDDSTGQYVMHSFDSRGITRISNMSLSDGVWKIWWEGTDFSQRFTGTFSEDGDTITGYFETSQDGSKWERDRRYYVQEGQINRIRRPSWRRRSLPPSRRQRGWTPPAYAYRLR